MVRLGRTLATLHRWTQIVGKLRLAATPPASHWWHAPLYVTARGLTTSGMPYTYAAGADLAHWPRSALESASCPSDRAPRRAWSTDTTGILDNGLTVQTQAAYNPSRENSCEPFDTEPGHHLIARQRCRGQKGQQEPGAHIPRSSDVCAMLGGGVSQVSSGAALVVHGPTAQPAVHLDELGAVIFDMDGVVTDTASVHAAAWKRLFDAYLEERSRRKREPFQPFDIDRDYRQYVDGKPRYDGVRDFLHSRGITLPEGESGDGPVSETVRGLGNRKDRYFMEYVTNNGVSPYPGTVELVRALHAADLGVAIISASRNLGEVLKAAGVDDLFDVRVGGVEAEQLGLKGKPDPAVFIEAARRLGVHPSNAAVIEDALAGVEAGKRGGFRLVVGVDRTGHAEDLRARGADVVVRDPGELLAWSQGTPSTAEAPTGFPEPTSDPAWLLEVVGFDPLAERDVESWLAVANGRTGTRGSVEEGSEESNPATYVAGVSGPASTADFS